MLPEGASDWMADREKLWNAVEKVEKRKDAQLARDFHISLPRELLPHHVIRRRLNTQRILPRLQVLPLELTGKLRLAGLNHKSQPKRIIYERNRYATVAVCFQLMLPNLLMEMVPGPGKPSISNSLLPIVIPGMRRVSHVEENVKVSDGILIPQATLNELYTHKFVHGWLYPWARKA